MARWYFHFWRIRKRDLLLLSLILGILYFGYSTYMDRLTVSAIKAMSWSIANRVIVIDPGHGGIDPGAVGKTGTLEKDINLEVAKKLQVLLSQAGAAVILTRDSDVDLADPDTSGLLTKKRQDLSRRVAIANERNAHIYLSIHVNSFPLSKWSGAQTFYQRGQPAGKKLAEAVQFELVRVLKNTKRVAKGMDFFTNRETKMASATVEIGFMSNPKEEALMQQEEYQAKLAYAIFAGIVKFFAEEGVQSR
ncbi:MAG: N-acetylmuramoyl-L-alanine amidase CwlD [Clostridia bacterium]|nr:N-acetylmuramoyl-L-alanine amidase CwlD [Clostridia bacterium]